MRTVAPRDVHVEVRDLRLAYESREVIHGISFDVYRNEILAVIGPAQSGKTSLLRCLNRTIDFTAAARVSGTIRVDGEDIRTTKDVFALRRKIGMVAPLPVGLPLDDLRQRGLRAAQLRSAGARPIWT